jgi:hypothetical protein
MLTRGCQRCPLGTRGREPSRLSQAAIRSSRFAVQHGQSAPHRLSCQPRMLLVDALYIVQIESADKKIWSPVSFEIGVDGSPAGDRPLLNPFPPGVGE